MKNGGKKGEKISKLKEGTQVGKIDGNLRWENCPFLYTQAFIKHYSIFLAFLQNICFSNDFSYENAWKQKSSKLHFAYKAYLAR